MKKVQVKVLVTQSWPTLCNPMDCSPPAPLPMEFCRQEYWSGLPFPSPGDLPNPRGRMKVSSIAGGFFTSWATREALAHSRCSIQVMCLIIWGKKTSQRFFPISSTFFLICPPPLPIVKWFINSAKKGTDGSDQPIPVSVQCQISFTAVSFLF